MNIKLNISKETLEKSRDSIVVNEGFRVLRELGVTVSDRRLSMEVNINLESTEDKSSGKGLGLFESTILRNPIYRASEIIRYSGIDSVRPEDIMQHTTQVSMMSYFLGLKLNEMYDEGIDIGLLVEKALVHDIDEVITGDIPRPTKYYSDSIRDGIKEMSESSVDILLSKYSGLSPNKESIKRVRDAIMDCKEGLEGALVNVTDLLTVAYKCHTEIVLLGNNKYVKVANDAVTYMSELSEYLRSPDSKYVDLLSNESTSYLVALVESTKHTLSEIVESRRDILEVMDYDGHTLVNPNNNSRR